ncbi:MAG: hydroxymethylbilane synthase [Candidatus Omnitrophica bacterium]|nr:hydroxymethylbilane synthase [Candidatus Omnitrophota bacterium]
MNTRLRVGVRPSLLAHKQAQEAAEMFPGLHFDVVCIETQGDKDKHTPLESLEGSDFFTREINEALRREEIDASVHSAKDLEVPFPDDLEVVLMSGSISPFDCLVSGPGYSLEELPGGSCVGTSSAARKRGVCRYRADLVVKDIRGNVDERIAQLVQGAYDAIIVAEAALIRLGAKINNKAVARIIPPEIMAPHPLQGRLAVVISHKRADVKEKLYESLHRRCRAG